MSTTMVAAAEPLQGAEGRPHLGHLDGLRGLAALYVAYFHAYQMQLFTGDMRNPLRAKLFLCLKPLCMGHYAVAVFIVLSGYCLMLPLARAGGSFRFKDGITGFFRRRARRIIPPFYAAILLSIAILPLTRAALMSAPRLGANEMATVRPADVVEHLLLINNIVGDIPNNNPLWSVATEWQIYFLFPALLLPVFRRLGIVAAVAAGVGVGSALSFVWDRRLYGACPWMLGLFAMGMAAALVVHSQDDRCACWRRKVPWGTVAATIIVAFLVVGVVRLGLFRHNLVLVDPVLGTGVMCLLVFLGGPSASKGAAIGRWCASMLSSRWARALGGFSYSLYLIHYPLLRLCRAWTLHASRNLLVVDAVVLIPTMAGILALAYLFSCVFERPFMRAAKAAQ